MVFGLPTFLRPSFTACAVLVAATAFTTRADAAEPVSDEAAVPAPDAAVPAPDAENSGSEATAPTEEVSAGAVPEPEAAPGAAPPPATEEPPIQSPTAVSEPAAPAASPAEAAPEADPGLDPTLLDAAEPEPTAPVATRTSTTDPSRLSPEERLEAMDAAYASRYRPADNPARLNVAARLMFANASGQQGVNGRVGGLAVDVGAAWNRIGVGASLTGWGGSIQLPEDVGAEMTAMLGGGPTLGLGRLALLSHGFLDLRAGYDVYYGVVNARGDAPEIVAAQDEDPRVSATLTENLMPHGPRLRLDMGLLGATNRRFFHGMGLSIGYQALVGSFRGDLPATHMLTMGLSYWMG